MALDIYVDRPVSAETSVTPSPRKPAWVGSAVVVALCAMLCVGVFIFLNRPDAGVDPDVNPPVASGLNVLIVEETSDQLPAEQVAIFSSIPLREWYKKHCADEDGHPAYRCFDKDTKLDRENEIWQKLRARITLPPPALLMVDGKKGKEMKLPSSPEQMQQVLEQFAKSKR